jgi:hypothetical protein
MYYGIIKHSCQISVRIDPMATELLYELTQLSPVEQILSNTQEYRHQKDSLKTHQCIWQVFSFLVQIFFLVNFLSGELRRKSRHRSSEVP